MYAYETSLEAWANPVQIPRQKEKAHLYGRHAPVVSPQVDGKPRAQRKGGDGSLMAC